MTIEELEKSVIKWANRHDLYRLSNDVTRMDKLFEEIEELEEEIFPSDGRINIEMIAMEAGDVLVTLINILHPLGLNLSTCLDAAYNKIDRRTGRMVNGTFVKDEE